MKWLRFSVLAVALLSLGVAPAAFAKDKEGGLLTPAPSKDGKFFLPEEWDITCPGGRTAVCIGSEADCLFLCDHFCGTSPGTCVSV